MRQVSGFRQSCEADVIERLLSRAEQVLQACCRSLQSGGRGWGERAGWRGRSVGLQQQQREMRSDSSIPRLDLAREMSK